jgi:holliday junction DNA helicase RuvA
MIATLTGTVTYKLSNSIVVDINGIGYELLTTVDDWGAAQLNEVQSFHIYEQIREDVHNLFGFSDVAAKELFIKLLSVNGVGPKVALATLSAAGVDRLSQAIASGDTSLLKGVSGVGKKTAERIMVELAGKVSTSSAPIHDETYQALVGLGYSNSQAADAIANLPADIADIGERVKLALKGMGR